MKVVFYDPNKASRKKVSTKNRNLKQHFQLDGASAQQKRQVPPSSATSYKVQSFPWLQTAIPVPSEQCPRETPETGNEDSAAGEQDTALAPATCEDQSRDSPRLGSCEPGGLNGDGLHQGSDCSGMEDAGPNGTIAGCGQYPDSHMNQGCLVQQGAHVRTSTECEHPSDNGSNLVVSERDIVDDPEGSRSPTCAWNVDHEDLIEVDEPRQQDASLIYVIEDSVEAQDIDVPTSHDACHVAPQSHRKLREPGRLHRAIICLLSQKVGARDRGRGTSNTEETTQVTTTVLAPRRRLLGRRLD